MNDAAVHELSETILEYWFSSIDDETRLDRETDPFRTCFGRWYGKQDEVDHEIRARFEPALLEVTRHGDDLDRQLEAWRGAPDGLVALTVLLDQFPRNMYRDTPAMYAHDPLALVVSMEAAREHRDAPLPLVRRMFLDLPLMHVENVTLQQAMVVRFERLRELAEARSPHSLGFYDMALDYARRHLAVVAQFGRFPHRNDILGRASTANERVFLERDDSRF